MYQIIKERSKILKDGRTNRSISDIIGIAEQHLSNIFRGNLKCKKVVALTLISMKEHIPINDDRMENFLNYYFTEE